MATYQGKLVEHGSAPYQDNPEKNTSYFAKLEYADGRTEKVWGVGLQDALQNSNVKEGDNVVLNNYGNKSVTIPDPNDPTKNITAKRNEWSVDLYEPYQNLTNEIAQDKEVVRQKTAEKIAKEAEEAWEGKTKKSVQDFDYLPDNIKNNYVGIVKNRNMSDEKINYYDKDDKGQVNIAFEDRKETLNTSRQDEKTVHAMLDLAESRGWTAISLKGTEEFKQKAWLEASLRGIETSGYKPTERDEAMLEAKQKERNFNTVVAETIEEPTHTRTENEQAPAEPTPTAEIESQGQEQDMTAPTAETAKAYQAVIVTQEFDQGTRSSWVEVREAGTLGIGSYEEDGRAVINTPYSKENALELGVARYRIDEIESMLERGDIEPYKEVVFERSPEEQAALEQESALMQAKIAEQKAIQKEWDDRHFNNLPLEQREAILDELQGDIEKQGIGWKIAEFEGSRERYDGTLDSFHQADWVREHIEAKELGKETAEEVVHNELVNESLAMREQYYQTGWEREQDVLSENYHEIGDRDFSLQNLNAELTEYKKPHYALDSNSDVHFIKGTIESLDIPSEAKKEVIDNFNNRMTKEFHVSDSHDMPHENRLLRSTAVMGRYDLKQVLNELDVPNKDEVLKAYDSKVIDYSQKASEHQKDFVNKEIEKESYIRSEEFNSGRDLGDDDVTLKADIERFGDNLAAPTGKTETQEAARQRVEAAFERKVDKTDREIKQEIRTLLQNGVRDGSIKDRSDIVEQLKERGFEVVRENEKSITLSNPNGKDIRLEGEMFTKNYDAFKSLNDSLKPDALKEKYPQISDENIAKIELWRQDVFSRYNTMEARQNGLSRLNGVVPDVASGKLDLGQPKFPANEIKPDMDIRTLDKGEQTRSR